MRGEVWLRRRDGRDGREFRGEPSGGVAMEEDTDDEPEAVEALSVLRMSAIGFEWERTGDRGVLVPWI